MVSLARTDAKLKTVRAAAPDNVQQHLLFFFYKKIRPGHLAVSGALKTDAVFSLRQDPCKAGLMPQAEQGICTQTLCS